MAKKPVIGSVEYVSLAGLRSFVPAKIDTGADYSAIWASNVILKEGVLRYCLFAPGSPYYTGEVHTTKAFKSASVKNSFGDSEVRYKIRLTIIIGKHRVISWFSLADRSRSTYPILLGKKVLHNRFIVDVSEDHVHGGDKRVLVISASPVVTKLFSQDASSNVRYTTAAFENFLFDINGPSTNITDTATGEDSAAFDATYVKEHWSYPEPAAALAEYLAFKDRLLFDKELQSYTSRSKLSEMMRLATHGLPVPRTLVARKPTLTLQADRIVRQLGFPFVLKNVMADRGRDNFFIQDRAGFEQAMAMMSDETIVAAQQYIANEGYYRVNVFGSDVALAVFRSPVGHKNPLKQHLNKPAGSANATLVKLSTLPADMMALSVKAAVCMNRQIAGVDILQDKLSDAWYILEVNNAPQLWTGAYTHEKSKAFADFIERKLTS